MAVDKNRPYKKLERDGEHAVRENLANGDYTQKKLWLVEEWLRQFKDRHDKRKLLD